MVTTAGYTNQGGREYNEDAHLVLRQGSNICAIVADGLGGHGGGSLASNTAVNAVKECFEAHSPKERILAEDVNAWFETANDRVLEMQTKECEMKTTMALVCLAFGSDTALTAHLGDTRIYQFVGGKLVHMSFDHSVSRMAVLAGEISMDQIRFHTDRNKLLKAVGKGDEAVPEIKELPLDRDAQNAFLICTDGFWEYVTEEQMEEDLRGADTPKEWLARMRRHIRETAKEGNDNNTAVAMFVS